MPSMFGGDKAQKKMIQDLPQQFLQVMREHHLPQVREPGGLSPPPSHLAAPSSPPCSRLFIKPLPLCYARRAFSLSSLLRLCG